MPQHQQITLAEARQACEQAGVFLLELSIEGVSEGAFAWLDGNAAILLREELPESKKAKLASGILERFSAGDPKMEELKRADEARMARSRSNHGLCA